MPRRRGGPGEAFTLDVRTLNNELVLGNRIVFGSVNANHRHFVSAAEALVGADPAWLEGMITRRVPLDRLSEALEGGPADIKNFVQLAD